jgi:hypothetical protein
MFFTKLTRIIALIILVACSFNVLFGIGIASEWFGPYEEAKVAYGDSAKKIDGGLRYILVALALGTLAEIGLAARRSPPISN